MISNLQFHQLHSDCLYKQNQQNRTYTKRRVNVRGKCSTLIYTYFIKNSWKSRKPALVNLWNFKYSSNTFATQPRLIYFFYCFSNIYTAFVLRFWSLKGKRSVRYDRDEWKGLAHVSWNAFKRVQIKRIPRLFCHTAPSRIIDANRCQAELKENALATPVSLERWTMIIYVYLTYMPLSAESYNNHCPRSFL